jgi:hypothetical protein
MLPRMQPRWRALVILAVGALIPMVRVLPGPHRLLVGTELSDVYKHTWSFWHTLNSWGLPRTDALNGPDGGVLLDLMWGPSLLMAPVTAVFGPVLAANLWMWISLTAVGAAAWWLARELVGDGPGAVLGGLAAQTATPLLGYPMLSGVHERLGVWLFPVLIVCVLRARDQGGWKPAVMGAAALFWVTLGCQAYGLYAAGMLVLALPLWLGHPREWVGRLKRLAPTGAGLLVAAGAAYALSAWLTVHPESLIPQPGRLDGDGPKLMLESASLAGLFNPSVARSVQPTLGGDELYVLTYVGWASIALAVVGSVLHKGEHRWAVRGVTGLALGMALFALGPRFQIGGQHFMNPVFVGVAAVIPHYGSNPPVWQHVLATASLLAPGLACAVHALPKLRWVGAGVALVLVGAERVATLPVAFPLPVTDAVVPDVYDAVVEPGGVVEIPRLYQDYSTTHGSLFLAQTRHRRPVPHTIDIGHSPWDTYLPVARGMANDWGAAGDCMRSAGFRYVVVHRDHYAQPELADRAIRGLGQPVADDGVVAVFDLGPIPETPLSAGPPVPRTSMELVEQGIAGRPIQHMQPAWLACPAGSTGGQPGR